MNLRVALQLGRVSNLPTVWTNVLGGVALAGGALDAGPVALLALALSLFYVGGMYLNDGFDRGWDAAHRPERPIPSGRVAASTVLAAGFGFLAAGLALTAVLAAASGAGGRPLVAAASLAALVIVYDLRHKGNPIAPVLMGLCRAGVYVTAGLIFAAAPASIVPAAAALAAYVVGLSTVARQETFGRIERAWPLALLAAPLVWTGALALRQGGLGAPLLFLAFLGWTIRALALLRPGRAQAAVPRAVVSLIAGISLFDAVVIAGQGRPGAALVALAGFGLTLFFQRYIAGT